MNTFAFVLRIKPPVLGEKDYQCPLKQVSCCRPLSMLLICLYRGPHGLVLAERIDDNATIQWNMAIVLQEQIEVVDALKACYCNRRRWQIEPSE